jgi:hypothetical protein
VEQYFAIVIYYCLRNVKYLMAIIHVYQQIIPVSKADGKESDIQSDFSNDICLSTNATFAQLEMTVVPCHAVPDDTACPFQLP